MGCIFSYGILTFSFVREAARSDICSRIFVGSVLKQAGHRACGVDWKRFCYLGDHGHVVDGIVTMADGVQKFWDDGN